MYIVDDVFAVDICCCDVLLYVSCPACYYCCHRRLISTSSSLTKLVTLTM